MSSARVFFGRSLVWSAAALCVVAVLSGPVLAAVIPISGMSPYPDGGDPNDPASVMACNGGPQPGVLYRNSETEPYIVVNPTNHDNMIASWHQDRWSTGSAQGVGTAYTMDGGMTWTFVNIRFTRCSGGLPGTTGYYERASDPWITFGPTGIAHYMALVSDRTTSRNGMAASRSTDGGVTWSDPVIIKSTNSRGPNARSHFHDKNSMTADPHDPDLVYATWTLFKNGGLSLLFSRSTDGGLTWESARPVNKYEKVGQWLGVGFRQGSQIVVLPDGTLLNTFYRGVGGRKPGVGFFLDIAIFRSRDQGKRWEKLDTPVSWMVPTGGFDIELQIPVRDAGQLPDIAVDMNNGYTYIVWQDGRYSEFGASNVLIARSTNGGDTWSEPALLTDASDPIHQSFLPTVAVAADGTVGVLYYDFRNDVFGDNELSTDVHLVMVDSDLNILGEQRLTDQSFDMRQMCLTGFRGYFPGDYVGLDAAGNDFVAAFTIANPLGLPVDFPQDNSIPQVDSHNRQDIVFVRVDRTPSVPEPQTASKLPDPRPEVVSGSTTPDGYALFGNVPNPFNPNTVIEFEIPSTEVVRLEVFDVRGRLVSTLASGAVYPAGRHAINWDGRNTNGQPVASGIYLYRLTAGSFVETKRMALMK